MTEIKKVSTWMTKVGVGGAEGTTSDTFVE